VPATANTQNHSPYQIGVLLDQEGVEREVLAGSGKYGPTLNIFNRVVEGRRKKVFLTVSAVEKVFHRGQFRSGPLNLTYTSSKGKEDKGEITIVLPPLTEEGKVVSKGFTIVVSEEDMDDLVAKCLAQLKEAEERAIARAKRAKEEKARQEKRKRDEEAAERRKAQAKPTQPARKSKPPKRESKPPKPKGEPVSEQKLADGKDDLKAHFKGKSRPKRKPRRKSGSRPERPAQSRPERPTRPERQFRPPRRPQPDRDINFYDRDQLEAGRAMMANDEG